MTAAEDREAIIDATRALLASMGRRKHWHGGDVDNPCPVCGGYRDKPMPMPPPVVELRIVPPLDDDQGFVRKETF